MSKLSELMHREIWSKRTSKIILAVVLVPPLLYCLCQSLNLSWVTPMEYSSAVAAVNAMESLNEVRFSDESDFVAKLDIEKIHFR